ncbi:hypothetical protein Y1Q_0014350 [Alligator mississippiensis]|uniref:Uncharacterized protein n=1 Tax=Alligator mississippiensis TaxID=8496 RepID=A0A151N2G7_ALLMI|nr:hypothetical protein Y1Q_0014350 [Alligator mississippiensis]
MLRRRKRTGRGSGHPSLTGFQTDAGFSLYPSYRGGEKAVREMLAALDPFGTGGNFQPDGEKWPSRSRLELPPSDPD